MLTIQLMGRITENGELEATLPAGLPPGEVHITIQIGEPEPTWTNEELTELLQPVRPMTGKEIVDAGLLGGWADEGITDGATWIEEQRRKQRERSEW